MLALAVTIGLAIGAIQFQRLKLDISGVFFPSLLFDQLGFTIDHHVLAFLRDFALIVFMYAIGLQVGAGIRGVASGRRRSTEHPRVFRHRVGRRDQWPGQ